MDSIIGIVLTFVLACLSMYCAYKMGYWTGYGAAVQDKRLPPKDGKSRLTEGYQPEPHEPRAIVPPAPPRDKR